jgi:hypothetical protein
LLAQSFSVALTGDTLNDVFVQKLQTWKGKLLVIVADRGKTAAKVPLLCFIVWLN